MKIAFLLYPVDKVRIDEDSSFWLMWELSRRGHEVYHFESRRLFCEGGRVLACLSRARLDRRRGYLPSPPAPAASDLSRFDCVFIRKEPPFDAEYLHALQLLNSLRNRVFLVNDAQGIAMCNEKLYVLDFPEFAPPTLVTVDPVQARRFIASLRGAAVIKPLTEKGGRGVFVGRPSDRNLPSLLEIATDSGRRRIVVQRYVSADRHGDKRIVLLDGKVLGAFLRLPGRLDYRANLSAGGSMHPAGVTARERQMVETMAPSLRRNGLHFVGIDVIGGYLTEVNVTSPAGIPEINRFRGVSIQRAVVSFLEARCGG